MSRRTSMLLLKAVVLQLFWFVAVYYGPRINDIYILLSTIIVVSVNYYIFRPDIKILNYFLLIPIFSFYGAIQDNLMSVVGIITFSEGYYPFWSNSLYLVFICYYGDLFNSLNRLPIYAIALLGGLGGSLAYHGGSVLGGIVVTNYFAFITFVFVGWSLFFPTTFYLFYKRFSKKS